MNRGLLAFVVFALSGLTGLAAAGDHPTAFVVTPAEVRLSGNLTRAQLVVTRSDVSGQIGERSEDLTRGAAFQSSDANVVSLTFAEPFPFANNCPRESTETTFASLD